MKYSYRVYAKIDDGYELIKITNDEKEAKILSQDNIYSRVLVVRHDHEMNADEPHMLTFPGNIKGVPKKIKRRNSYE